MNYSRIEEIPEVSQVDLAFGNTKLMPKWEEIPKDFKHGKTKWNELFSIWFYRGLEGITLDKIDGLTNEEATKVVRYIRSFMVSFQPKHEHKEAAVAYILSLYFRGWVKSDQT